MASCGATDLDELSGVQYTIKIRKIGILGLQ